MCYFSSDENCEARTPPTKSPRDSQTMDFIGAIVLCSASVKMWEDDGLIISFYALKIIIIHRMHYPMKLHSRRVAESFSWEDRVVGECVRERYLWTLTLHLGRNIFFIVQNCLVPFRRHSNNNNREIGSHGIFYPYSPVLKFKKEKERT